MLNNADLHVRNIIANQLCNIIFVHIIRTDLILISCMCLIVMGLFKDLTVIQMKFTLLKIDAHNHLTAA
jgi:hypothetical protein